MAKLSASTLERGVITASAGNHAQGVALSAQKLGCDCHHRYARNHTAVKIDAVRARGGEVVLHSVSFNDAYDYAVQLVEQT